MAPHIKKPHQRTITKVNLVVRMEMANPMLSSIQVAELCGIKPSRFASLKMHPYYRRIYNQYTTGVFSDLDIAVKDNFNLNRSTLDMAVPVALQALYLQALQVKDLRVQNKAANDLLAMHGKYPKVTKVAVTTQGEVAGAGEERDNKIALELIKALNEVNKKPTPNTDPTQTPASIDTPPLTETTQ